MVTYPLNDTSDLSDELNQFGDNSTEDQLRRQLDRASKQVRRDHGRTIKDRLWKKRENQTEFDLTFPGVEEFVRLVLDDEEVEASKYDVSGGRVDITDSDLQDELKDRRDYALEAEYVPEMFATRELDIAMYRVLRKSVSSHSDEEARAMVQDLKEDIKSQKSQINSLAASALSPERGEHAKRIDRKRRRL